MEEKKLKEITPNKENEDSKKFDIHAEIKKAVEAETKRLKEQNEKLMKNLEEEKHKNKYVPEPAEIPKDQQGLPKGIQSSDIKTSIRNMSDIIKEKMHQLKDIATMELLLDTSVRMKKRLESVKKMGSAEHLKVRGIWKTIPPQMHIARLEGKKISNDEYTISFGVYETDTNGNKVLYTNYAEVLLHDGSRINRAMSAEYRIAYEVVETIRTGKPITREIVRIDRKEEKTQ